MLTQEVSRRYARALFLASSEKGMVDSAFVQMQELLSYVQTEPKLLDYLRSPRVLVDEKVDLVRRTFSSQLDQLFVEFVVVLVNKRRIAFLPDIIDEFIRLVEAQKGIGRITVISAVPLTDSERAKLSEKMALKTGLKIELEEKVDPSIIGGIIVLLHDEIIDGSVKYGLSQMREQLMKVKVVA